MNRPILPMNISFRLLIFSYPQYLAHDPPSNPNITAKFTISPDKAKPAGRQEKKAKGLFSDER